jgi:hypothetical protein
MTDIKTEQVDHLVHVFTWMADRPQTLPSDIADEFKHNMRYSRELLGVLLAKKIVVLDTSTTSTGWT